MLYLCLTGLRDVEKPHIELIEAVVGQNVVLPCTANSRVDYTIVSVEWNKKNEDNTKLVLYSPGHGLYNFWLNVTLDIDKNKSKSFPLHLSAVNKWNSGIYVCHISSFPLGSLSFETELKVKGKNMPSHTIHTYYPDYTVWATLNV